MESVKIIQKGTFIVLVFLFVFGLLPGESFAEPQKIKVGIVVSKTGSVAFMGRDALLGFEFATDRVNGAGGIKSLGGAKLELVVGDNESKPEVGMSETERLIKEGVSALIEGGVSSIGFAVTQVAEKHKTPMLVPLSVADAITERGFKYIFRLDFKASWTARDTLRCVKWLGESSGKMAKTLGLLTEDTMWGQSTAKAWKSLAPKYGFKVAGHFPYSKKVQDISPTISKLKAARPDIVLQCSYLNDAVLITRTMRELDFNCMARIACGGGHSDPRFIENVKDLADYIFVLHMWHHTIKGPGTKIQDTNAAFKKRYGEDINDWASYCYDAILVLADALERAGSTDRQKLRDALAKTDMNIEDSDIIHPFPMRFDETGQAPAICPITQIQKDGEFTVWPPENAARWPIYPMPTWKERGMR
ncbi:MAG: ABC transporter substrate-binding protein [Deltaproteobacteria bacterium]|nr:ABC transporter substrate-binding protein [Deltaproteobacteria bacterium]